MPRTLRSSRSGQTMTEYILLVGLIALACIAAVKFFGRNAKTSGTVIAKQVQDPIPAK